MALWTTYLAFVKVARPLNPKAIFKFVMRDRGNDEVAPSKELLALGKKGIITWDEYAKNYLKEIKKPIAIAWMYNVAQESKDHEVVLVCFEKDAEHCHRTLLAKEIVRQYPFVDYKGELLKVS